MNSCSCVTIATIIICLNKTILQKLKTQMFVKSEKKLRTSSDSTFLTDKVKSELKNQEKVVLFS